MSSIPVAQHLRDGAHPAGHHARPGRHCFKEAVRHVLVIGRENKDRALLEQGYPFLYPQDADETQAPLACYVSELILQPAAHLFWIIQAGDDPINLLVSSGQRWEHSQQIFQTLRARIDFLVSGANEEDLTCSIIVSLTQAPELGKFQAIRDDPHSRL